MGDRFLDTLDQGGGSFLQLKVVVYQCLDCVGNHDGARGSQARDPRSKVGGQPVHVVLRGVQIHEPAMNPNPNIHLDREATLCLLAEPSHLSRDLQTGMHRPTHIVLVGNRVAEHGKQPITVSGANVPLVSVHRAQDHLAVAAYQEPIRLRLHLRR
jgi:hypothetical protein